MERLFFVVNPVAGSGQAQSGFDEVRAELERRGAEFGFAYTERKGHATELAAEAIRDGYRNIVSVGGDGTASEVAAAVIEDDRCVMGILPFGTGNDLAKTLGIPKEPMAALETLLKGSPRSMDVGVVNERMFINVAGMGFDVDVLLNTDKYKAKYKGMLPYLMGIAKSIAKTSFPRAVIKDESGRVIDREILIIIVGNGRYFGGGMNATPQADPFDGLFDVCIVRRISKPRMVRLLLSFIKGRHVGLEPVEYYRAREVSVVTQPERRVQLDGEIVLATPVTFSLRPAALKLLLS